MISKETTARGCPAQQRFPKSTCAHNPFFVSGLLTRYSMVVRSRSSGVGLVDFSRISIPGPMECAVLLESGNTYGLSQHGGRLTLFPRSVWSHVFPRPVRTFVPLQPNLYAASCAKSSPKPSIMPLMKGRIRLMAVPRTRPQMLGGWYRIMGDDDEDDSGDVDASSPAEYCSLSECMVTPDSAR